MPLINIQAYKRNLNLGSFDMSQFQLVNGITNTMGYYTANNRFFQYQTNKLYSTQDAFQGMPQVNSSPPTLPLYNYGDLVASQSTGRLFMMPCNDPNNNYSGMYTSDDNGVTWSIKNLASYRWHYGGIATNNECIITTCYYASGTATGATYRSLDNGDTWTNITSAIQTKTGSYGFTSIMYSPTFQKWFATRGGSNLYTSTDNGDTWTKTTHAAGPAFNNFKDFGTHLVSNSGTAINPYRISTDGVNWTIPNFDMGEQYGPMSFTMGAELFVSVYRSGKVYTTTDFVNWSLGQLPNAPTQARYVAFTNNQFIIGGNINGYYALQV